MDIVSLAWAGLMVVFTFSVAVSAVLPEALGKSE